MADGPQHCNAIFLIEHVPSVSEKESLFLIIAVVVLQLTNSGDSIIDICVKPGT